MRRTRGIFPENERNKMKQARSGWLNFARTLSAVCVITSALSGCVSTARIYRDSEKSPLKGIPFYSKVGWCVMSETWERRWLDVRLRKWREVAGKKVYQDVFQELHVKETAPELVELRKAVAAGRKWSSRIRRKGIWKAGSGGELGGQTGATTRCERHLGGFERQERGSRRFRSHVLPQ